MPSSGVIFFDQADAAQMACEQLNNFFLIDRPMRLNLAADVVSIFFLVTRPAIKPPRSSLWLSIYLCLYLCMLTIFYLTRRVPCRLESAMIQHTHRPVGTQA